MIIDILKDISWINELEPFNLALKKAHEKYFRKPQDCHRLPDTLDDFNWFNPPNYRKQPLSRHYPNIPKEEQYLYDRPEYKLIFHLSNYLPLFVIRELYKDRKDVLIEDVGCGNGNLIFYLANSGFTNFDTFEKFVECPKKLFDDMMTSARVRPEINNLNLNPVIIHNSSAPRFCFIAPGLDRYGSYEPEDKIYYKVKRDLSNTELICVYCNADWELRADTMLPYLDFSKLCQDTDHLGTVYCRNDKLKEFTDKLKKYDTADRT